MSSNKIYGMQSAGVRFMENHKGDGFAGDRTEAGTPSSTMSKRVEACIAQIAKLAKRNAKTTLQVSEAILKSSDDELTRYIVSKKDAPLPTYKQRIMQAALLRLSDIATVATAGLMSTTDANAHIMEAESEALSVSHPDSGGILSYTTQAALSYVIDELVKQLGAVDVVDAENKLSHAAAFGNNNFNNGGQTHKMKSNNFDLSSLVPSLSSTPSAGATISTTTTDDSGDDDDDDDSGASLTDIIGSIVGGAGALSGIVKSTTGAISNTASDVGSQSIAKYLAQYGVVIVVVILLIVFIIIFAARATR